MHNSASVNHLQAVNFVITNVRGYNLILGMVWLQKQNCDINWDLGVWQRHTGTNAKDRQICLVYTSAFVAVMRAEKGHGYKLHLTNLDLDCNTAKDAFMATGPELTVLDAYRAYACVFFTMN